MMTEGYCKKVELIVAGLGGQGVLTMGEFLARAGMSAYEHVSFRPSYGIEARGGPSECVVILSDSEILFPVLSEAQTVVIMDASQLKGFENKVRPGGTLIIEKERSRDKVERDDIEVIEIPAIEVARKIGDVRAANFVFLGAYLEVTNALPLECIETELESRVKRETVVATNKAALRQGAKLVADLASDISGV